MPTPALGITHIAQGQSQKEVTANEAFDILDANVNIFFSASLGDADLTLTDDQFIKNGLFRFVGSMTTDRTVTLPGSPRRMIFWNETTGNFNIIFTYGGSPGVHQVVLSQGERSIVHGDGENLFKITTNIFSHVKDIETPINRTYVLDESAPKRYRVDRLIGKLSTGEMTVSIQIGGVAVTGLNALGQDSAQSDNSATALNFVDIGDRVTLVATNAEGSPTPLDYSFTLKCLEGWDA